MPSEFIPTDADYDNFIKFIQRRYAKDPANYGGSLKSIFISAKNKVLKANKRIMDTMNYLLTYRTKKAASAKPASLRKKKIISSDELDYEQEDPELQEAYQDGTITPAQQEKVSGHGKAKKKKRASKEALNILLKSGYIFLTTYHKTLFL